MKSDDDIISSLEGIKPKDKAPRNRSVRPGDELL